MLQRGSLCVATSSKVRFWWGMRKLLVRECHFSSWLTKSRQRKSWLSWWEGEVSETRSFVPLDFLRCVWSAPNRVLMLHRPTYLCSTPLKLSPYASAFLTFPFTWGKKKKTCVCTETCDSPAEQDSPIHGSKWDWNALPVVSNLQFLYYCFVVQVIESRSS